MDAATVLGVADQLRGRAKYLRGIRAEAMAKQFERWAADLGRACGDPACDVCGQPVPPGTGQTTAADVICGACLDRAKGA